MTCIVAQKVCVHVHDELAREATRTLCCHFWGRRFGLRHAKNRAIGFVHRYEGSGHSRGCLKKLPTREALML